MPNQSAPLQHEEWQEEGLVEGWWRLRACGQDGRRCGGERHAVSRRPATVLRENEMWWGILVDLGFHLGLVGYMGEGTGRKFGPFGLGEHTQNLVEKIWSIGNLYWDPPKKTIGEKSAKMLTLIRGNAAIEAQRNWLLWLAAGLCPVPLLAVLKY